MRLDKYLVEHHGFTRNRAQFLIENGLVSVDGRIITKSAFPVLDVNVCVGEDKRVDWVSRSAGKLDAFLEVCDFSLEAKLCLDVGASTGGFTQVLLERGASRVVSVDVGTTQLHDKIRRDIRVESFENMDIREFVYNQKFDVIVADVSFVSMEVVFPSIVEFAHEETNFFLLWKPQFEVGAEHLRKTGVPRDETVVTKKLHQFQEFIGKLGFQILRLEKSSVIGEAGNKEWMVWLTEGKPNGRLNNER